MKRLASALRAHCSALAEEFQETEPVLPWSPDECLELRRLVSLLQSF